MRKLVAMNFVSSVFTFVRKLGGTVSHLPEFAPNKRRGRMDKEVEKTDAVFSEAAYLLGIPSAHSESEFSRSIGFALRRGPDSKGNDASKNEAPANRRNDLTAGTP
jgi:hypothetical protein